MTAASKAMATPKRPHKMTKEERKIIFATSLGTVFEWYDFYIFGSLAAVMAKHFYAPSISPTMGLVFALLTFAAGFAARPFGAFVFGRLGDLVGRKYTFLVTISLMGGATFLFGLLPGYESVGILAPILLLALRLIQGLAIGGEYGGAAIYVAEHSPHDRRGFYTSWIQTTAALGAFLSFGIILAVRLLMRDDTLEGAARDAEFESWGWRLPYLFSAVLLIVSIWIRLKLSESPLFTKMKAEGTHSKTPLKDSFTKWKNLRYVLVALFGINMGQAVIFYTCQFYSLTFITALLKMDPIAANWMLIIATALTTPFFVFFGALSDRIGRKWIIMTGMACAVLFYFPIFKGITHFGNPALEQAVATTPVVIQTDPADCNSQFDPIGKRVFTSPCDIAARTLANKGIPYNYQDAPAGTVASINVGTVAIPSYNAALPADADQAAKDALAASKKEFDEKLATALKEANYPASANPVEANYVMVTILIMITMLFSTMTYGPLAATLVELFPTRIRYSSMSVPYHFGNGWFGGFLPATSLAIVVATGNIYAGLWYPIIIAGVCFVVGSIFLHETKNVDITTHEHK
ncbi:MAG: MFS transporter [Candidatus Symbiobacter sp.]|nr:MFS transporter [Candidatus Symbiobacter sp.]